MRERSEIVVLTIVVTCEARVGMFYTRKDQESTFHHCGGSVKLVQAGQETSRKQFLPLGGCCEVRNSLFK